MAATTAETIQTHEQITEFQFVILRHAVTLAKDERLHRLALLRMRLQSIYPAHDVNVALQFWADHSARSHHGR